MATQHFKRNLLLNLYREEKISLVCFLLPLKRDKGYLHRPGNSIQPGAIPLTLLQETFATSEDNWVCQIFWVLRSRGLRCFFSYKFFSMVVYPGILGTVPMLYSRTLLFAHSIYNGFHLLSPILQSILPANLLPLATTNLFSCLWVCSCSTDRFICVRF